MTAFGVFIGNEPADLRVYEAWLGADVDFVRIHGGRASWADHLGSLGWLGGRFAASGANLYWSVPLLVSGTTLEEAAEGVFNENYQAAARAIIERSPSTGAIHVRVGEEFNGGWFPWAAREHEDEFVTAFRTFVAAFRSASDRFVFEWNVNIGDMGMDPALAYPGDDVVDIIGMDFYYDVAHAPTDPAIAWDYMTLRPYGLQWLEHFAAAHGKPTAYSEWGVNSPDAAAYIAKAFAWFSNHNVAYQSYWDSDSDFAGKLSDENSATASAFLAAVAALGEAPEVYVGRPEAPALAATGWERWIGGTAGADTLVGDQRNDNIQGSDGADVQVGRTGDDFYTVENTKDIVVELAGEGIDTIHSYATVTTAADNVEHLKLLANYAQTGHGNALDNRLTGSDQSNVLDGRGGDDWLTGGGGVDIFIIAEDPGDDVIVDFRPGEGDRIDLRAFGLDDTALFAAVREWTTPEGRDVTIRLAADALLTLLDMSAAELDPQHFLL